LKRAAKPKKQLRNARSPRAHQSIPEQHQEHVRKILEKMPEPLRKVFEL
jgi:hypothetical protein